MYSCEDAVEPISDTFGEQATNAALYNVIAPASGSCALTYDAGDMTVDLAAGNITHFGTTVPISALANAFTLVSDPTNPRWTWLALSSAGAAAVVSGDPAAAPAVPELGDRVAVALVYVQAGLMVAASATYKLDKRVPAVPQPTVKYKTATQVRTTDTAYVDVIAAGTPATMSFSIGASEVWEADYWLPNILFGGTGGVKFQITGPAAPTNVDITGTRTLLVSTSTTDNLSQNLVIPIPGVTAFSTDIGAASSTATTTTADAGKYYGPSVASPAVLNIKLRVINGTTAGTVTLQVAQNSSNSTTTLGIGGIMNARRIP